MKNVERVAKEMGISVEQAELIAASVKNMPKVSVDESGTFEMRSLYTPEMLAESRRRRGLAA